jgi:hypothetical protein
MKYRIIHEQDANGTGHYEAQYQLVLWFGITKWVFVETFVGPETHWPTHFTSFQAAEDAVTTLIRSRVRSRVVVAQGAVTGPAS